jgi:PAS domain S-box-containing protein
MAEKSTLVDLKCRIRELQGKYDALLKTQQEPTAPQALPHTTMECISEAEWQTTFDAINSALWILDRDFHIVRTNRAARQMFQRTESEMIGKYCWEIVHGTKEPIPECPILRSKKSLQREHMELQLADRWFEVTVDPVLDENGAYTMAVHIIADVTERKRTQEALRESEEKFRSMMEAMKEAAYITSSDFRIKYMNPRMISRVGSNAIGRICHKTIYGRDKKCQWCVLDRILEGEHVDYELADPKSNRYYAVVNAPVYESSGEISNLSILHDITERRAIESQLNLARKMESTGTLVGGIAHDFNNILYMIMGNTELALEDVPAWNPAHDQLQEIKTAGLRAADIVNQLLNFSCKSDHDLKPIDLIHVIKDAIKFMHRSLPSNITVSKHLPETEIVIQADPVLIHQLVVNICTNASQVMEGPGGIIDIIAKTDFLSRDFSNKHPKLRSGYYATIEISDSGPGIDPTVIDRIFDPYFTTKPFGKGSGMGLAVVHGIVTNHGGVVTVESTPGKGAVFTIHLPLVDDQALPESKESEEIPCGTESILFIDDEASIVNMNRNILERLGYQVDTRMNPEDALNLFQSRPQEYDLVITDMTMPQMTGVQLTEQLKALRSDIPVIICTGHSSLIDEKKAFELEIDAYLMKPITKRAIAKTIRGVLDKVRGADQE